jgi:hypothetical protein
MARCGGRASVRSRGAEAQRQWESPGGAPAHCAYLAMHAYAGSATQGPRRHAFDRVSSASGTGCTRLHR